MAKMSFSLTSWQPVAVADTTNFTDNGYCAIQGANSTQRVAVEEIAIGGQASSSAVMQMLFGRDSTVGATLTALTTNQYNAALDGANSALSSAPTCFTASTTKPKRSSTLGGLLNFSFNAFGGSVRWIAAPGQAISLVGNAASLGELSLSGASGCASSTSIGTHIIYEVA